jgi:WD40 repeat protein
VSLTSGTRLGPYEILAPIGAGGMGEVYRAKDPRLGRDVAIKVLPASFSQDADRLKRFEQEARAAGVLNHPGITAVYDIGTADGAPYIVTELLEGETLRNRLLSGPLSVRKAIDYAVQIAKGLAAAHERGIVHRDLKPENLFLTKDGRVKILDFGLAKLKPETGEDGKTDMQTVSGGTEPGVVLGTMGYMSPEQVRGKAADKRSDLFAFGTILYEMLAGQRAFRGDTAADTITAILTKEPPDLSHTNKEIHPGLDRIVRHCLEKNPEERFESARDVAFDLEALSGVSASSAATGVHAFPESKRRLVPLAIAGLVLLASGVGIGVYGGKSVWLRPPPLYAQLTFRRGQIESARFTPDGQTILYTAAWDGMPLEIFVRRTESPESRLFGMVGADLLSISSSGEMALSLGRRPIDGFNRTGTLARMGVGGGGAPREVLEDVQWADWAPDGSLAVARQVGGRTRLEFPIGRVLFNSSGYITHPRVSRGGDLVAFIDHPARGDDGGYVAVVDRSGKKRILSQTFPTAWGLAWSQDSGELWLSAATVGFNRALFALTLSGRQRLLARVPGMLTICDVSRDGRVLLTYDKRKNGIISLQAGETKERDLSWLDWSTPDDLSADGKTMLFDESGEGGGTGYSVFIRKTDGSPAIRLGEGGALALSPDGKLALAIVHPTSDAQLVVYPTGAGEARLLSREGLSVQSAGFLPDGKRIIFAATESDRGVRIYVRDLAGGKPRAVSPEGYFGFFNAVSPDGKMIPASGPDQRLYLYPIEGGEPTPLPGSTAEDKPSGWSSDGRLYLFRGGELPARVYLVNVMSGQKELWKDLAPSDAAGVSAISRLYVTPDGKSYVYNHVRTLSDLYLVQGLK